MSKLFVALRRPRAAFVVATLLWLICAVPSWAQGAAPAPARLAGKAKSGAQPVGKPASQPAVPVGFSMASVPAWVEAVQGEGSTPVPDAPLQMLLIDRQTRVDRGNTTRFSHLVRQVNDARGVQKGAQIEIEFDPTYQKLVLHHLAVWRGSQRIDKLDAKRVALLHRETQLERQIIDGQMTASVVLDDLRAGDRVEWAYSLVGDNPVFDGRFVEALWTSHNAGPTGLWRLRVLMPSSRVLRYRVADGTVAVNQREQEQWRETVFTRRGVPQFQYDEYLPGTAYLKDRVELSEFSNWSEVAAWAQGLFARAMQPSAAVEEQAAAMRQQAAVPMDRLRRALDFVQQDIRYFGTETGPYGHQPAAAEVVLKQRFGDCKDKAALLSTLLGQLGIEATPVLVSLQLRDGVEQSLPSPLAFDHAIVRAKVDDQVLWLDATRALQSGDPLHRQSLALGRGLLARADSAALVALPDGHEVVLTDTTDTFSFGTLAQEGSFESVTVYQADAAENVREAQAAMPAADFEKALMSDTLRSYPALVPSAPLQVELLADRNAVKVTARYKTGAHWRFPEQRALVGDYVLLHLMAVLRLPDQTPRTQPLQLGMPGRHLHKLRYQFAEDTYDQPSSGAFDEVNRHFELHLRFRGERNAQIVEADLRRLNTIIEAADWPAYRDALVKVWPRLSNVVAVSPLTLAQTEALRGQVAELDQQLRRRQSSLTTRVQVQAQVRLYMLDKALAGDRLSDKLRMETLVAQATALDHLGRVAEGEAAFRKAVALDAAHATAHAGLAVNALLRGQDAQAIESATRALQLAPDDTGSRYTLAWARYFSGDVAPARDELRDLLKSTSEVERSYGAMWLYLATRRLGADGVAAVQTYKPTAQRPPWPYPVLRFLVDEIDIDAALVAGQENGQLDAGRACELYFYAAQKALADADIAKARAYLKKSLATGVVEFNEHAMARRELERIDKR